MLKFKRDFHRAGLLTARFVFFMPISAGILFVVTFAAEQYFEYLFQLLNDTDQGPWPAQIGEFGFGLVSDFVMLLLVGYFLVNLNGKMTWKQFFDRDLAPLTAESLRALTSILLWALALIIPGFVMYCRLSFVPFIVFVDPTYKTRPDAVARSKELTQNCWLKLTFLVLALMVIETLFEVGPSLLKIDCLYIRAPFDLCGFIFSLFGLFILYVIFENLVQESQAKGAV